MKLGVQYKIGFKIYKASEKKLIVKFKPISILSGEHYMANSWFIFIIYLNRKFPDEISGFDKQIEKMIYKYNKNFCRNIVLFVFKAKKFRFCKIRNIILCKRVW